MIVVIPMAGRGSRFAEVGFEDAKPLIDVRGRPMYSWAVDSLPIQLVQRLVFVCLQEHLDRCDLQEDIESRYGELNPVIVAVEEVTDGQACTVLLARDYIDNDTPLMIYNADTYCRNSLAKSLSELQKTSDGVISVFRADGDRWSFARTDANQRVIETAEKRRISEWACTGLYHFSRGRDFVRHADAMIVEDDRSNGEFYVAPVYNRLIAEGANIQMDFAEDVWVLGTPDELDHFNRNFK